ncbi:hypothetical protein TrRE_jg3600 [Triparma retinervis]|uniref:Sulfotransferase n=1 Tax=Triparma retinervis TaxID=2557542 RepID=A0A9W7FWF4_9STRA|nr:hypothetical protein TrRE_jg3600 [Triparma retinervis]
MKQMVHEVHEVHVVKKVQKVQEGQLKPSHSTTFPKTGDDYSKDSKSSRSSTICFVVKGLILVYLLVLLAMQVTSTPSSYSSPVHIPSPQRLLIGGSDGSGTRSVVKLCQDLGVEMVIDDYGTYDVHGQEMMGGKGWPEVVKPVIEETSTGDYDFRSLSQPTRDLLRNEIGRMNQAHERKVRNKGTASSVTYGIKAPVSMLLVPAFREIWGGMKFIHVVRDGRDIAFSGNQSPVGKFYHSFYKDWATREGTWTGETGIRVKGIQLWSDWNSQVLDYSARAASEPSSNYDFLVVRLEDLLDSSKRYGVIKSVASFLGSTKTDREICCMANAGVKDMGSHTRGNKPSDVKKRYGKWHGPLEANPEMSREVHEQGGNGLSVFGYEPDTGIGEYEGNDSCRC